MIVKRSGITFLAFLYLLTHLFMAGCSTTGDEMDDEALEVNESGEEYVEEGNGEVVEGEEQFSNEEQFSDEEQFSEENGENFNNDYSANEGLAENAGEEFAENYNTNIEGDNYSATENENIDANLQQIISDAEMNNATTETVADAPVNDTGMEAAIVEDMGLDAAAAAPSDMAPMTETMVSNAAPAVGASTVPALPEMGSKMPYVVQAGDTLGKIATKIYGNPDRWTDIKELSSLSDVNKVYPGDVVYYQLTQETTAFATTYEGLQRVEIVVQQGDTLSGIAAQVTGSWANWKSIWRQNADIENPDRLTVGQTLYYMNINTLGAAINYVKDVKVADLLNVTKEVKTEQVAPVAKVVSTATTASASFDVSGSELVKDVLNNVLVKISNSLAS